MIINSFFEFIDIFHNSNNLVILLKPVKNLRFVNTFSKYFEFWSKDHFTFLVDKSWKWYVDFYVMNKSNLKLQQIKYNFTN